MLYLLLIITIVILFLFFGKKEVINPKLEETSIPHKNEATLIHHERKFTLASKYKWSVITKSKATIEVKFENDDLGTVGYVIYRDYKSDLISRQLSAYIRDNFENKLLKIVSDGSSESMIGVDHPVHGHIGYLSFIEVDKI